MRSVCRRLHGTFTLVAIDSQRPDEIVAARRSSPLVIGVGVGETFLASDVSAFLPYTREAVELGQDQVVTITPEGYAVSDFDGASVEGRAVPRGLGRGGGRARRLPDASWTRRSPSNPPRWPTR